MGSIAAQSGMARELFQSINVMFSGRRGTLATATIGACAALGSVSGSSVAMVATMSHVAVPEMRRAEYDERLALGSVVAGATLGILFPPSVMLIFYGLTAVQSIPKLFAAGIHSRPGAGDVADRRGQDRDLAQCRHWAPISPPAPWRERLRASLGMWKLLCIFMLSIGGIYAGWFSPTEAAAIGAFSTIVIATLSGGLTFRKLADAALESSRTAAMLFFILLGAIMFSYFIVQTQIATNLADWVVSLHLPPTAVMVVVVLFYIVLGSFLESLTMILITVPVFAPLAQGLGYDLDLVRRAAGGADRGRHDPSAHGHEPVRPTVASAGRQARKDVCRQRHVSCGKRRPDRAAACIPTARIVAAAPFVLNRCARGRAEFEK